MGETWKGIFSKGYYKEHQEGLLCQCDLHSASKQKQLPDEVLYNIYLQYQARLLRY